MISFADTTMKQKNLLQNLFGSIGADLPASIVVFLVALPLCLGVAVASDAAPFAGLIAGVVGGIVVGSLSGSHVSVSGPAAGLTIIVATAIGGASSYEAFLLAVVVSGIIQLIFGFARFGVIGEYIPASVIKGMLAAIGLMLILKQIPHLVGHDEIPEGDEEFIQADGHNTFTELWAMLSDLSPTAIGIGLFSLAILLIWDTKFFKQNKVLRLIPGSLIVVVLAIAIHEYLKANVPSLTLATNHMVTIPVSSSFNEFTSFFTFPDFSAIATGFVWITAIKLAIVASLESLLSIEASDKIDSQKRFSPPNRELLAQGVGNMTSGLIGGLPVTAVIVRSSANISAGNKTKMSTIFHGLLLLLSVYFAPEFLNKIPLSALAAVLIMVGYKLTKPSIFKDLYKKGWDQIIPFVITIAAILFTDLLIGILIGIVAGLFFVLRTNFKNGITFVSEGNYYLVRLRKDVSFLNKPKLKQSLESIPDDSKVIIDLSKSDFVDNDIKELIQDFRTQAEYRGISVEVKLGDRNIQI